MKMINYISLFSGIGGFELGIQNVIPNAHCIGFSEVDKFAVKVYSHHFPDHNNLGDITMITEEMIRDLVERSGGCDLLVGGFPCQNLTSLARTHSCNSDGLDGPKSGLFWTMVQVIQWIKIYNPVGKTLHLVIENNNSMKNIYKQQITGTLELIYENDNINIHQTMLNGADFGVQRRQRLYWTTFPILMETITCIQTWDDILLSDIDVKQLEISEKRLVRANKETNIKVNNGASFYFKKTGNGYKKIKILTSLKTKWHHYGYCHMDVSKSTPMIRTSDDISNVLYDSRNKLLRYLHPIEKERLFFLPDGWVSDLCSKSRSGMLLGNTVIVKVIEFIISQMITGGCLA